MNLSRRRSEAGFTLIELLIAMTVSGIIMTALATGYVSALRGTQGLHERFVQSHDAQLLAVYFPSDVQSADPELVGASATDAATLTGCAGSSPGENLLRLQWTEQATATKLTAFSASYRIEQASSSEPATLTRYFCTGTADLSGGTFPPVATILAGATPASQIVARHLDPARTVAVTPPAVSMTLNSFQSDEHASPFKYTLAGRMRVATGAPSALSISRVGPETTTPGPVSWTVTFSEGVTGVNDGDFDLVATGGVTGATITGVTGSGTTWTVAANSGSGTGALGLNLDDDDTIVDAATPPNKLGGTGAGNGNITGAVFTISAAPPAGDTTPPTVTINQATGQADPAASGSTVNFTVVFSEAVTGFTEADVVLGTSGGTITKVLSGTGPTYTLAVSGASSGTLTAAIPADVVQDLAGNNNEASTATDAEVTIVAAGIAFQSSATGITTSPNGDAATSLTIPKPPGVAVGDLLLAQVTFEKGNAAGSDSELTPTGWTLVARRSNGGNIGQAIFRRTAVASDLSVASYAFPFGQSLKAVGGILRYTGVHTTNPIVGFSGNDGNSGTLTATSVNAEAGSMLVAFFGVKKTTTLSEPTGMTSQYFDQNPQGVSIRARDETRSTAGATGDRTSVPGQGEKWVAQLVTLRAAP